MSTKKISIVFAAVVGLLVLLGFAARSALAVETPAPVRLDVRIAPDVTLETVSIAEDRSVHVDGHSAGLDGACLPVQVFVEGEREPWWPVYRCLQVADDGGWSLRIPSDDGGNPMEIHLQVGE